MTINTKIADHYEAYVPQGENWLATHAEDTFGGIDKSAWREISPKSTAVAKEAYEAWVARLVKQFKSSEFDFDALNTPEGFEAFHASSVEDIQAYWAARGLEAQPHHAVFFMVDSAVKFFRRTDNNRWPVLHQAVRKYGHTVLNEPSQSLLKELFADEKRYTSAGTTEEVDASYKTRQARIRDFCGQYGGSPLVVDAYARSRTHTHGG
jgi:hypothetical protein